MHLHAITFGTVAHSVVFSDIDFPLVALSLVMNHWKEVISKYVFGEFIINYPRVNDGIRSS